MSYSFQAQGATKDEAIASVIAKMDEVVAGQPVHAADREPVIEAAKAFIGLLVEDDEKDVSVSVSGSVGCTYPDSYARTSGTINLYASLVKR